MKPFTALALFPTGIRAEIGGYAGDATPAVNLLAAACDRLVTHPNALNAATLFAPARNVLYVEGHGLDRFCQAQWALRPVRANRVGLLLDVAVRDRAPGALPALLNAAHAVGTVGAVDLCGVTFTERRVGAAAGLSTDGTSHGTVADPETLLAGARSLIDQGAQAVAIACLLEDIPEEAVASYQAGRACDPIGGVEAVLSHLVTSELAIPCAHAPVEPECEAPVQVDPRAAAEELGAPYLPCVLLGLARAPRYVPMDRRQPEDLVFGAIDALVVPASCMGSIPVLAAVQQGIPIIAVDNPTALDVTAQKLGLPGVLAASSYLEAAGLLLALRHGLAPAALRRPYQPLVVPSSCTALC